MTESAPPTVASMCAELGQVSHATGRELLALLEREAARARSDDVKKHLALLALIIAKAKIEGVTALLKARQS
jgi:hypothetical protein